jgi:large subunit ribosomal protein L3
MKSLLGIKIGMTQVIDANGMVQPVTVIQAGPCYVTQVKTEQSDGYNAIQIGFEEVKERRLTRGEQGHLGILKSTRNSSRPKRSTNIPAVRHLKEFRTRRVGEYQVGQVLTVEQFEVGDQVDVVGKSKGRGFAGVVKRHGFAGGPKTHGQSDRQRAPGSIGGTSGVGHVIKGLKMAGRMGNDRVTTQNIQVVRVDPERNLIAVKGPVPGAKGSLVTIRNTAKEK